MAIKRHNSQLVVLKHLAQGFEESPFKLRRLLRLKYGKTGKWKWESGSAEIEGVVLYLQSILGKSFSGSPTLFPHMRSPTASETVIPSKIKRVVASTKTVH